MDSHVPVKKKWQGYHRYVNEAILSQRNLTGLQKIFLSVLICSSKDGVCKLSNATLARRINVYTPPTDESVRRLVVVLEQKKFLYRVPADKVNGKRDHTKRFFNLVLTSKWASLPKNKYDTVVEILPTDSSFEIPYERMIVRSHLQAFPSMPNWKRAGLLGTSQTSLVNHKTKIKRTLQDIKVFPPEFLPQDSMKDFMKGSRHTYKDTNKGDSELSQINSRRINLVVDSSHSEPIGSRVTSPREEKINKTCESPDSLNQSPIPFNRTALKAVRPSYPTKTYKTLDEIEQNWNTLPNLRTHKDPSKKVYHLATTYINWLEKGRLDKIVAPSILVAKLGRQMGIKASDVLKVYQKKWTREERIAIYDKLNYMKRPGSKYADMMPPDFPSLVYNPRTQMSWFIYVHLLPEIDTGLVSIQDRETVVEEIRSHCVPPTRPEEITVETLNDRIDDIRRLVTNPDMYTEREYLDVVGALWKFYEKAHLHRLPGYNIFKGGFQEYLRQLKEWMDDKYGYGDVEITLGWFYPRARPHWKFLYWVMSDFVDTDSCAQTVKDLLQHRMSL